jgi:hypothetical protein
VIISRIVVGASATTTVKVASPMMTMPTINRNFDSIEDKLEKLESRWWKRIHATLTLPMQ